VKGLVVNGAAPSGGDLGVEELERDQVLRSPRRVVARRLAPEEEAAELRAFLEAIAGPASGAGESGRTPFEAQSAAAKAAFGKTSEDLEAAWKKQASR
jgi:hypothetical protein